MIHPRSKAWHFRAWCVTLLAFGTSAVRATEDAGGAGTETEVTEAPQASLPSPPPPATDVVPHLHAPIQPGRNLIYSAGFQLVWNAMWDRFTKDPPMLEPASEFTASLNLSEIAEADISPGSVLIACGRVGDDEVERARGDMAARFPGTIFPMPDIVPDEGGPPRIFIYAHLEKSLAFKDPFIPLPKTDFHFVPENWSAAKVRTTSVRGFGLEPDFHPAAKQVTIHYFSRDPAGDSSNHRFVVELITQSTDAELLLARIPPGPTMRASLEEVARLRKVMPEIRKLAGAEMSRLADLPADDGKRISYRERQKAEQGVFDSSPTMSGAYDSLIVPIIDFHLLRDYVELAGRRVLNHRGETGTPVITRATQTLRFRLDEKGLELKDDSEMEEEENGVAGRHLDFTRPFLLLLNERKSGKTVFAAWIGNAELLEAAPVRARPPAGPLPDDLDPFSSDFDLPPDISDPPSSR